MIKSLSLAFLVLLINTALNAQDINIKERNNGIDIDISGFSKNYVLSQNFDKTFSADLITDLISGYSPYCKFATEEIRLLIAIPEKGEITIEYELSNESYLRKVEISDNPIFEFVNVSKPSTEVYLERIGKKRGISLALIAIRPFKYNRDTKDLSIIDDFKIQVNFDQISTSKTYNDYRELLHFQNVINTGHLVSMLYDVNKNKKIKNKIMAGNNWYDPNKEYIKISTTRDGIAKISCSEIINAVPSFIDKDKRYFHLLQNGIEKHFSFKDNDEGVLSANDEIIFIGSRPSSDTTWLDPYSNEAAFYLYYDESKEGLRFSPFENAQPNQKFVEYVNQKMHFEEEHYYIFGYENENDPGIVNIEKVEGEGWMWEIISPYARQAFEYNFFAIPYQQESNKTKTSIMMESSRYNRTRELHHQISYAMNNDTVEIYKFKGEQRYNVEHDLGLSWFVPGINNLFLLSIGYLDPSPYNYKIVPDELAVDYFEISGKFVPWAFRGQSSFSTPDINDPSFLVVNGFRDKDIIVIDTSWNTIATPYSETGTSVSVGVNGGNRHYASIVINDSIYSSKERGLHIFSYNTETNSYASRYFSKEIISNASSYLSSLVNNTIIISCYNGADPLGSSISNFYGNLGSSNVNNLGANKSWAFLTIKGNSNFNKEHVADNSIAGFHDFLTSQGRYGQQLRMSLAAGRSYKLILSDETAMESPKIEKAASSDLYNQDNQADVILLTHKNYIDFANSLKKLREKTHPDLTYKIIDVDDVYKEYGFGNKSPHAIKSMLRYALENWQKPAPGFLTLIGDASWDPRMVMNSSKYPDYIPTYGNPVSDHWYGVMGENKTVSDLSIGRIPLKSMTDGNNYLDKLLEYENIPKNPWMKNFFYMSGGYDEYQLHVFATDMRKNAEIIKNSNICADTFLLRKRNFDAVAEIEAEQIIEKINSGMMMSSYLGHGSATLLEIEGWQVERLNNKGKYGFLSFISCNTGAFAEPNVVARNEDYLLYPKKGFIGAAGGTTTGFAGSIVTLYEDLMKSLVDPDIEFTSYAALLRYAKSIQYGTYYNTVVSNTFSYLGDPLTEIKIEKIPDLYLIREEINRTVSEKVLFDSDSSIAINGNVYNMGFRTDEEVEVLIVVDNELYPSDSLWNTLQGVCKDGYFEDKINIFEKPGRYSVTVIIDPEQKIIDAERENNKITFSFDVFSQGLLPLEPLAYWDMPNINPVFRFINPSEDKDLARYEFRLLNAKDTANPILLSSNDEIVIKENFVEWQTTTSLENNKLYWVSAFAIYDDLKKTSSFLFIPFRAKQDHNIYQAEWSHKEMASLVDNQLSNLAISDVGGQAQISLGKTEVPFEVLSVHGSPDIPRDAEIKVNNKYYITSPPDNLGFNIVVLDSATLLPKYIKHFDTYYDTTSSERMVYFLRDSVEMGDYLMLALLDESFKVVAEAGRRTNPVGSWDTIKVELRKFGSVLCDSIKQRDYPFWWSWGYSFAMVGWKGAPPGTIVEKVNYVSDTAFVAGSFVRYDTLGYFSTRNIGPAREWNYVSFDGVMPQTDASTNIEIYGISSKNFSEEKLFTVENKHFIDISSIDAIEYPYIKIKVSMSRSSGISNPYISGIYCDFDPSSEFAIINSKSALSHEELMRGETIEYHYEIENISPRQRSLESQFILTIDSDNSIVDQIFIDVEDLNENEQKTIEGELLTDDFATKNNFSALVNSPVSQNEIYYFNNEVKTLTLDIYEDTTPPWIEMTLDGVPATENMYVATQPFVEINIFDDSRLPLEEVQYIQYRINGGWVPLTQDMITGFGRQINKKSKISFISDTLEFGENLISVEVKDITGNKGTFEIRVNVSRNGFVRNLNNYPNPFVNKTLFRFEYQAPRQGANAIMSIYTNTGQIVRSLDKEISVGANEFLWDGLDSFGNSLPSGAYFYLLRIESDVYVDNNAGKVLIVK